jgi:alternate signal-mediated exported protein
MNKSTKGALAAGTAAVLLLGGAGSLAYWNSTGTISGGAIKAGDLSITAPTCPGGWTYDSGETTPGATYTPGTSLLVPGDSISETCTTTLTATGEHMRGTIVASTPTAIAPFTVGVSSITDATTALASGGTFTEANNGDALSVTVTVTFPGSSDNTTKLASKTLDAITLTATQIHS